MWLEPLSIRQGGYLKALDHYNGELDTPEGREALYARVGGALPAVLVSTGDEQYKMHNKRGNDWRNSLELEVLVFSDARRSREAQNLGDEHNVVDETIDPGCYQILEDIFNLVTNRQTGDCRNSRFEPEFTRVVIQTPEFTMWRTRFNLTWNLKTLGDSDLDSAPAITSVHHKHNLFDDDDPPPSSIQPVAEGLAS
jgi:phage gp37-like protein